jgi:aspartate/tyrosine/aromatic aminotransferase
MPCSPCSTRAEGDVVLLHACCHNPTGFDLSHDDWRVCWTWCGA